MPSLLFSDDLEKKAAAHRTLEWQCSVFHSAASCLHAKVVGGKDARCSIEVWLTSGLGRSGEELVYCRGIACPRDHQLRILWLGRRGERPAHERVRGLHCVQLPGYGEPVQKRASQCKKHTLAESVFGLVAAIASCFGADTIELQALDNGSGRLVQYYLQMGFEMTKQVDSDLLWMEAPLDIIARLAPDAWFWQLVNEDFSGRDWMLGHLAHVRDETRLLDRVKRPWRWNVKWPSNCQVSTRFLVYKGDVTHQLVFNRIFLEVDFVTGGGSSLASCRANLFTERRVLRVTWLGQVGFKPTHPAVRGMKEYTAGPGASAESTAPSGITVSMGIVGVTVAMARWLGAETVELIAPDDGRGRLVPYLRRHGFEEVMPKTEESRGQKLEAPCDVIFENCCPLDWRAELPQAGDVLSMFVRNWDPEELFATSMTASKSVEPAAAMAQGGGAARIALATAVNSVNNSTSTMPVAVESGIVTTAGVAAPCVEERQPHQFSKKLEVPKRIQTAIAMDVPSSGESQSAALMSSVASSQKKPATSIPVPTVLDVETESEWADALGWSERQITVPPQSDTATYSRELDNAETGSPPNQPLGLQARKTMPAGFSIPLAKATESACKIDSPCFRNDYQACQLSSPSNHPVGLQLRKTMPAGISKSLVKVTGNSSKIDPAAFTDDHQASKQSSPSNQPVGLQTRNTMPTGFSRSLEKMTGSASKLDSPTFTDDHQASQQSFGGGCKAMTVSMLGFGNKNQSSDIRARSLNRNRIEATAQRRNLSTPSLPAVQGSHWSYASSEEFRPTDTSRCKTSKMSPHAAFVSSASPSANTMTRLMALGKDDQDNEFCRGRSRARWREAATAEVEPPQRTVPSPQEDYRSRRVVLDALAPLKELIQRRKEAFAHTY